MMTLVVTGLIVSLTQRFHSRRQRIHQDKRGIVWCMPIIPGPRRLRQEVGEFESSMLYCKPLSKNTKTSKPERWPEKVSSL
jgi:hypothetical protein